VDGSCVGGAHKRVNESGKFKLSGSGKATVKPICQLTWLALSNHHQYPCSVDSAEFPYITLKCKLKLASHFSRNVNQVISGTLQVKFWYRFFSVNRSTKPSIKMVLSVMNLLIFTNQHPGLCGNIALYEVESTYQSKKHASFASGSLARCREIRHYQHCRG